MSRQAAFATLAGVVAALHAASFWNPDQSIVTDIRYYLYFAWRIAEGAVPHLDYFGNKTALASFAGALLYRLGSALGVDPLSAIRLGYLGLAALGGPLAFVVFRRLSGGAQLPGFLGLFAYLAFGLLAALPAVGNVPKLLMALASATTALLVHDRRWIAAGAMGVVAFMDWQIGALAWVAALLTAWVGDRGQRRGAALRVIAGGALGAAPFAAYYALHGALRVTFEQTVRASLFRGSATMAETDLPGRLARIADLVERACPAQEWLFALALAGLAVAPVQLVRRRGSPAWRLLLPLCVYHYGVVAFSLVDFQGFGDLFLLLHSAAFFLGIVWTALYGGLRSRIARPSAPPWRTKALAAGALALAVLAARPGPLRPELVLRSPDVPADVSLAEQRRVADEVQRRTAGGTLVVLGNSELLFLMRHANPVPLAYWNNATWSAFRSSQAEAFDAAAMRIVFSARPDAFVLSRRIRPSPEALRDYELTVLGRPGGYRVPLFTRRATASLTGPRSGGTLSP
jgi:hypothetical protein